MKHIVIVILMAISITVAGQSFTVSYTYDKAGNRATMTFLYLKSGVDTAEKNLDEVMADSAALAQVPGEIPREGWAPPLDQLVGQKNVRLYPNPTRAKIIVELVGDYASAAGSVQVVDMAGKKVAGSDQLTNVNYIDMSRLPDANYKMILKVGDETKTYTVVKVE
jgi:hypothetical protein